MSMLQRIAAVVGFGVLSAAFAANAAVIDFENVTGPSLFAQAVPADYTITIGGYDVVVHGGAVLTNTTNLPADETSVYGTASFASGGFLNPLTISFFDAVTHAPKNITNLFLDVLNGLTTPIDYTVADNMGNTASFNLAPNLSSGTKTVGFAAAGSVVTITAAGDIWDFFVDNIHFNEPLPNHAPEPGSLALLALAIAALGLQRSLKQRA